MKLVISQKHDIINLVYGDIITLKINNSLQKMSTINRTLH